MKIIIITGMSGAGKSQAVKVFEDLGYFVVDNLPPNLLGKFIDVLTSAKGKMDEVAMVMDIRSGHFFEGIEEAIEDLTSRHLDYEILFLDAEDDELVTRFKETRRVHPLSSRDRLLTGIQKEREMLGPIKARADYVIDTTGLALRTFQEKIKQRYVNQDVSQQFNITLVSFGFKYGVPVDADLIFDVRFIENPFYIDELRSQSGLDQPVQEFVLGNEVTREFLKKSLDLFQFLFPHYIEEGKKQLIIGIGCTGGRHRSVAITDELTKELCFKGYHATSFHRDLEEDYRPRQHKG